MEKVTLYDQKQNKMYDIFLSKDDARRVASDMVFATSLLNSVIKENTEHKLLEVSNFANNNNQLKESEISSVDDNIQSIDEISEVSTNDNVNWMDEVSETSTVTNNTDQLVDGCEEGTSLYRWSDPCVLLLLRTYQEMEHKFTNGKMSHKKCWELIAKSLKNKGYDITASQCASKLRSLKKTYKSIKEHNAKSGNNRRTWQHFEIMEEIFSKKAWCRPVAIASSTGLSIKNTSPEESVTTPNSHDFLDNVENSENNDLFEKDYSKDVKTTRTSTTKLLQKRLAQKEIHEQKRQKRHDERMALGEKLVDKLTKLLEK